MISYISIHDLIPFMGYQESHTQITQCDKTNKLLWLRLHSTKKSIYKIHLDFCTKWTTALTPKRINHLGINLTKVKYLNSTKYCWKTLKTKWQQLQPWIKRLTTIKRAMLGLARSLRHKVTSNLHLEMTWWILLPRIALRLTYMINNTHQGGLTYPRLPSTQKPPPLPRRAIPLFTLPALLPHLVSKPKAYFSCHDFLFA